MRLQVRYETILVHTGMAPQEVRSSSGPGPQNLEVTVDTIRISPAGDPFHAAPHHDDHDERPHACNQGFVYIGHQVVGEDGEEVDVIEAVPCRRCARCADSR